MNALLCAEHVVLVCTGRGITQKSLFWKTPGVGHGAKAGVPSGISSTGQGGGGGAVCGQELSDRDSRRGWGGPGEGKGQLPQPGRLHALQRLHTDGGGGVGGVEDRALWSFFGIINIQLVTMNIQLGRDLQRGP